MKWVLIFWLYSGSGAVATSAEFEDQKACENALQAVQANMSSSNFRKGLCLPTRS